jgi:WXG100 family type VII secretion target
MSDQVGASSSAMAQAVSDFNARVAEFEQASQRINTAVSNLASTWKGAGYQAFVSAMDKWRKDMEAVSTDLQQLSEATHKSNEAFQSLDQQIKQAFSGF